MSLINVLLLAIFGGIGASCRFLISQCVSSSFPIGTWVVNITGSFLLGVLSGYAISGQLTSSWLAVLGAGFCGGFTTFSSASLETVALLRERRYWHATSNLLVMALICILAAGRGFLLVT